MNGIDRILQKIEEEAKQREREIISEAEAEAAALKAEREKQALEVAARRAELAREEGEAEERRILSAAQQQCRTQQLAAKRGLVLAAFDEAYKKLVSLPDEKLTELIAAMAAPLISGAGDELLLAPSYERLCGAVSDAVKAKNPAFSGRVLVSPRMKDAGFVIRLGLVEQNMTFGALIKEQKERLEEKVVAILFSRGE